VSAALHAIAFLCLIGAAAALWRIDPGASALLRGAAMAASLAVAGVLLTLEQRWAENVNLAFFKVNVVVGFAVLAMVLGMRAAGSF
jgi:hypothetical protein